MKILIDTVLLPDDYKELVENFSTFEFIEKPDIHTGENNYYEVVVDTNDLIILEELEWIKNWLNVGYVLKYNNNQYVLG